MFNPIGAGHEILEKCISAKSFSLFTANCIMLRLCDVLSVLRKSDDDLYKLFFLTHSADWKPNTTLEVRQEKFQGSKTLRLKMVNWSVLFELHGHWTINREKTTGNILEISRRFCR